MNPLIRKPTGPPTPGPGHGQVFLGTSAEPSTPGRADQLAGLYRLSDPALSELPMLAQLDEILVRLREILGVDTAALLLLDESTNELVATAAKGIEAEVEQGVRLPLGHGFAGRIAAERVPIFIADVDHADVLNPLLHERGICSLLGVPLIVESRTLGVLHVGTLSPRTFDNTDAALLQLAAARIAPAIERAQLFDALEREHRGAVALQRSLLPDVLPAIPGLDLAALYLPARDEVGGDWYDVIELGDGRVGVAIGDVAGHGVRAAALMGQLRTGLRAYALLGLGPAETLARLDALLQATHRRGMATVSYLVADPATDTLTMTTAGHPPAVLIRPEGEARLLGEVVAPPLGTVSFPHYRECTLELPPGEALLLYTDGLIERRRVRLTERLAALREAAAAGAADSAEALCRRVVDALLPAEGAEDDVAVVALRREPIGDELRLRPSAEPGVLAGMRRSLRRWLTEQRVGEEDTRSLILAAGEAWANAVEHAHGAGPATFEFVAARENGSVVMSVRDHGHWRERSGGPDRGRGLTIIERSVDELELRRGESGTELVMRRRIQR